MKLSSRIVQRTLAYVNKLRKLQGRKPLKRMPKGRPMMITACPVAKALTSPFGNATARTSSKHGPQIIFYDRVGRHHIVRGPKYVNDFMEAFDCSYIPELIER